MNLLLLSALSLHQGSWASSGQSTFAVQSKSPSMTSVRCASKWSKRTASSTTSGWTEVREAPEGPTGPVSKSRQYPLPQLRSQRWTQMSSCTYGPLTTCKFANWPLWMFSDMWFGERVNACSWFSNDLAILRISVPENMNITVWTWTALLLSRMGEKKKKAHWSEFIDIKSADMIFFFLLSNLIIKPNLKVCFYGWGNKKK